MLCYNYNYILLLFGVTLSVCCKCATFQKRVLSKHMYIFQYFILTFNQSHYPQNGIFKITSKLVKWGQLNTFDRNCIRCNSNDIEDEFQFVLVCPDYINLRNAYIPKYYSNMPSVLKFIVLVQINNISLLIKLSIYCIKAFALIYS